jgi:hypothetical protein
MQSYGLSVWGISFGVRRHHAGFSEMRIGENLFDGMKKQKYRVIKSESFAQAWLMFLNAGQI